MLLTVEIVLVGLLGISYHKCACHMLVGSKLEVPPHLNCQAPEFAPISRKHKFCLIRCFDWFKLPSIDFHFFQLNKLQATAKFLDLELCSYALFSKQTDQHHVIVILVMVPSCIWPHPRQEDLIPHNNLSKILTFPQFQSLAVSQL